MCNFMAVSTLSRLLLSCPSSYLSKPSSAWPSKLDAAAFSAACASAACRAASSAANRASRLKSGLSPAAAYTRSAGLNLDPRLMLSNRQHAGMHLHGEIGTRPRVSTAMCQWQTAQQYWLATGNAQVLGSPRRTFGPESRQCNRVVR